MENTKPKRTRSYALTFRVSEAEREMIERKMQQSGIKNMRAYLLKQAIDGRIIHVELDSVKEMVRLLSNATNNINQIAKRVNQTSNLYAADVAVMQTHIDELWTQANEILKRVAAL